MCLVTVTAMHLNILLSTFDSRHINESQLFNRIESD